MNKLGVLFFLSFSQFLCAQNGLPTVEDVDGGWGKVSVDKPVEESGILGESGSAQPMFRPDRKAEQVVQGGGVVAGTPTHDDEKPSESSHTSKEDLRKAQQEARTEFSVIPVPAASERQQSVAKDARKTSNGDDSAVVKPEAGVAIPVISDSIPKGKVHNNSFLWNLISVPFSYVGCFFKGFMNITGLSRLFLGSL